MYIHNSGVTKHGPGQMGACSSFQLLCSAILNVGTPCDCDRMGLVYSNKTVKYSIKAVSSLDCAGYAKDTQVLISFNLTNR